MLKYLQHLQMNKTGYELFKMLMASANMETGGKNCFCIDSETISIYCLQTDDMQICEDSLLVVW